MRAVKAFGVVVVGDEILCGKRTDKHLPHCVAALRARGLQIAWSRVVGDHRQRLIHELRQTQQDDLPVLCFGGIGATPDDQTRQAAAEAFGTRLIRHPDAVAMIEEQFGDEAYPNRVRMAELPEDCLLIPNPYNRIPGFTLYDHHFLPGFPSMAWPMLEWVLDHYYSNGAAPEVERSVRVMHVRESELIPLMESLSAKHGRAKLFSLPHMADVQTIELGFRGTREAVDTAFAELLAALAHSSFEFETLQQDAGMDALRRVLV